MSAQQVLLSQELGTEAGATALVLRRLTLRKFKGVKEFTLDTDGADASVFGDNATGKTTVFDGFDWLFFDKDSQNRKDFQIKTLGPDGQPVHREKHEVEGVFSYKGRTFTLKKVYTEKWVKPRGSATEEFSGHETAYFVDGLEKKKQDYEAFIAQIASEGIFRLLSDPAYFNEVLKWEERRRILLEVCGNISDDEVIATEPSLSGIKEILGNHTLDDHRTFLKAEKSRIEKEQKLIPARISEVQRGLPDVSGVDPTALPQIIEQAKDDRKAKFEELTRAEQGGGASDKQARLAEVGAKLSKMDIEAQAKHFAALTAKRNDLSALRDKVADADRQIANLNDQAQRADRKAADLSTRRDTLRGEYRAVRDQVFSADVACPTCGQQIPEAKLRESRGSFNVQRADKLEAIQTEGKGLKVEQEKLEAEATKCRKESTVLMGTLAKLTKERQGLDSTVKTMEAQHPTATETPAYTALAEERDRLIDEIKEIQTGGSASLGGLREELAALETNVSGLERVSLLVEQRKTGERRIEELKAQEKALAAEYEQVQKDFTLTDKLLEAKVRLLEGKINGFFRYAKFKLFDQQVNGEWVMCCEATYKGVPYAANLNRGAKMNVGLDIIRTLSRHYGFAAPIFIDNREAVSYLIPVDSQMISLVVSEADKSLRIVKEVR